MSQPANHIPRFPIIPEEENRCIWMDLGMISFKLCDRNYQCEDCPLDIGMRGGINATPPTSLAPDGQSDHWQNRSFHLNLLKKMIGPYFEKDRYYHPRHCWIRLISQERVLIGFDSAAATVLGTIDQVYMPKSGMKIKSGETLLKISQKNRHFNIISPISGDIIHVNAEIGQSPNRLLSDPMKGGWICAIKPNALEEELSKCLAGIDAIPWYIQELLCLEYHVSTCIEKTKTSFSNTLNDGGDFCSDLGKLLAEEDYLKLVHNLIG